MVDCYVVLVDDIVMGKKKEKRKKTHHKNVFCWDGDTLEAGKRF
jgi:hypothetical protein